MSSSTKLDIREEQILHGSEGVQGRGRQWWEVGERNDPNNVCTCE
jgi:hypothetical protein